MAPSRILPWWPHILFAVLEPAALILGFNDAFFAPSLFHHRQVPPAYSTSATPTTIPPHTAILVFQLSNIYLLLAALAMLILFFSSPRTVRGYLMIIALADIGHIYSVYLGMTGGEGVGAGAFWDWRNWNDMVAGNVGASVFLCVNRIATLLGLFGSFRDPEGERRVEAKGKGE